MKKNIFILLLSLVCLFSEAQVSESITVKAGEDLQTVLSSHGLYRFPSFKRGVVTLRDGSMAAALMNFNIFLNEMQFIDPKGDTLVIAEPATIDSISIDSALFYYKKGYLQVVENQAAAKLVMKQKITFIPVKIGAYGTTSQSSAIDNYRSLMSPVFAHNNVLALNEDIIVKKETNYSIIYKKFREAAATRSGFQTAFPDHKKAIDDYISSEKIDFRKESDLKKLLLFCTQQS